MADIVKTSEPGRQAEPATSSAAVRGASLLIALQVAARAATFVANQLLLRYLTAQLLGVATQLEVYYLSVLFFARESLRVAIQRQGGGQAEAEAKKRSSQSAVNLAYVSILVGIAVAFVLGWLYLQSVQGTVVAETPFFAAGLYLYAAAAVLELLSEPAFVVLQLRLRFGARAAAESAATGLRCAVTLGTAVWCARRDGVDAGVLPFALGQLAYAAGLLGVYAWTGASLAQQDGFSLLPQRLSTTGAATTSSVLALFDRGTLQLAGSMAAQGVVKHVLTQGDTFLVSVLSTPADQGVYALANNYGGLAARLLFQPVEESCRSYFSRLLAGGGRDAAAVRKARGDLLALVRFYLLFSLVVTAIGPAAAAPFLAIVTGPRWADSGAAATLTAYVWYLPLLAVNGVAEAFVASVASEADVHRQSAWMGVFSVIFASAGFVSLRLLRWGAVGLVAANAVNMACRIAWSGAFIRRYFVAHDVPLAAEDLLPDPGTVVAAVVARAFDERLAVAYRDNDLSTQGPVAQLTQLAKVAAVGIPFVVAMLYFEQKFLQKCYKLARGNTE